MTARVKVICTQDDDTVSVVESVCVFMVCWVSVCVNGLEITLFCFNYWWKCINGFIITMTSASSLGYTIQTSEITLS